MEHRRLKQLPSRFQAIPAFQGKYGKYLRNKEEEETRMFQKYQKFISTFVRLFKRTYYINISNM